VGVSYTTSWDLTDDPDEPEPPRRRLCAFCGAELPPDRRKYCTDKHAGRDRQRRKREHHRARDVIPRIPTTADWKRMEDMQPGEWERLLACATCRCNGHDILDRDPLLGYRCIKCGRQRPGTTLAQREVPA
jgi:hypothetical protein